MNLPAAILCQERLAGNFLPTSMLGRFEQVQLLKSSLLVAGWFYWDFTGGFVSLVAFPNGTTRLNPRLSGDGAIRTSGALTTF
jgi:hypothetical protein